MKITNMCKLNTENNKKQQHKNVFNSKGINKNTYILTPY